jgi:hypothetical protein
MIESNEGNLRREENFLDRYMEEKCTWVCMKVQERNNDYMRKIEAYLGSL